MDLPDVNVLVSAYRDDAPEHGRCWRRLNATVNGPTAFAISDLVLSSFIRVVTHPGIFKIPSPVEDAMAFATGIRELEHCVPVFPGPRHWAIFSSLCREAEAKGNVVQTPTSRHSQSSRGRNG